MTRRTEIVFPSRIIDMTHAFPLAADNLLAQPDVAVVAANLKALVIDTNTPPCFAMRTNEMLGAVGSLQPGVA